MAAIFSRWPLFLSNARYVNRSNSDVGITFSENILLRMFYFRNGAWPSKILDGNHFSTWLPFLLNPYINSSNGDAIITFGTNILQGTFSWKKVCATEKLKMATIFKMATISVRGQCNVLRNR